MPSTYADNRINLKEFDCVKISEDFQDIVSEASAKLYVVETDGHYGIPVVG